MRLSGQTFSPQSEAPSELFCGYLHQGKLVKLLIQPEMPEIGEEALVEGLCMLPSASEKGS